MSPSRTRTAATAASTAGTVSVRALLLPCAFIAALAGLGYLLRGSAVLTGSLWGAAALLLGWTGALALAARSEGRALAVEVAIRKPHWVQASAQASLILYWGYHVPGVYGFAPFILAQLLFAFPFSMLLAWSRRDSYELGFGPFPIIFSVNLFLLFRPDWFYWQFGIVALGYLAKEFIRWDKGGRSAHVFNPSSFPLAVFSLVLILTGTTDTTFGVEIAQTLFNPPNIYVVIFLVALPGQILFGVTTMTISAVVTTYLFGLVYFQVTGTYYFFDSYVPIAVFLGMHLLFTDPSTSPRTEAGRIVFGMLYGAGTIAAYAILIGVGIPTFYDKLLPVPILNVLIQLLDRAAASGRFRFLDTSRLGTAATPLRRRAAFVGVWVAAFFTLLALRGVGDNHPGQFVPFWEDACEQGKPRACAYLAVLHEDYCERGSGWGCNEFGLHLAGRPDRAAESLAFFQRGCDLGFVAACSNGAALVSGSGQLARAAPLDADLPILVGGAKGAAEDTDPAALAARACELGWPERCPRTFND